MKQRIILAGGSGLIGGLLAKHFAARGWEVIVLTRSPENPGGGAREVYWDGHSIGAWAKELEGSAAVVNLAGRSVNCRYHARNRQEIMNSRVLSTRVVGEAIARCERPPKVWLNASTATIYKHSLTRAMDEFTGEIGATPEAKDAFSVTVAEAWEKAFEETATPRTRKVAMRSAMVLALGRNSVFPVLRTLVKLGCGGKMGGGKQYVSWIHEADFCRAVDWLMERDDLDGVVNLAAPNPIPNAQMMQTLRRICGVSLGLPAALWMLETGAFLLRTETELIIKSRRVVPTKLLRAGFQFKFPTLEAALRELTARADRSLSGV